MKKAKVAFLAVSAAGSFAAMLPTHVSAAAITCTNPSDNKTVVTCSGDGSSSYVTQAINFTGSAGVQLGVSDVASGVGAGVGLCGGHIDGNQRYGLTTNGGSMETVTGSGGSGTANVGSGGC